METKARYAVSRRLFEAKLAARSVPFTDEQWGRIYQQARLDYKAPGTWIRNHILGVLGAITQAKPRPARPPVPANRLIFNEALRTHTVPFTDEQWGQVYRQAKLNNTRPGAWIRDHMLVILEHAEKNRKPR